MNGMRTFGASLKGLRKSAFVEGVDGVAHTLGVAAKTLGDLVGVLAPVAGEQNLAERRKVKASGERNPASKALSKRDSSAPGLRGARALVGEGDLADCFGAFGAVVL